MKVIYEPHPVTPERKAELLAQGYKIIDAIFKPREEKTEDAQQQPVKRSRSKKAE